LALFSLSCKQRLDSSKINVKGGEEVSADDKYVLGTEALIYNDTPIEEKDGKIIAEGPRCTGVAIHKKVIVTAAHCLVDKDNGPPKFIYF